MMLSGSLFLVRSFSEDGRLQVDDDALSLSLSLTLHALLFICLKIRLLSCG